MLSTITENATTLKTEYSKIIEDNEANSVYFKTVDNCIKKLQKLLEKQTVSEMSSSKIVSELIKIFNSTIIKNFAKKELCNIIDKFLLDCGFLKKELSVGYRLEDEDFEFIGDMPLDVYVSDPSQNNVIQSKEHDAYVINYTDDEGRAYRVIVGKYSIGIYKE